MAEAPWWHAIMLSIPAGSTSNKPVCCSFSFCYHIDGIFWLGSGGMQRVLWIKCYANTSENFAFRFWSSSFYDSPFRFGWCEKIINWYFAKRKIIACWLPTFDSAKRGKNLIKKYFHRALAFLTRKNIKSAEATPHTLRSHSFATLARTAFYHSLIPDCNS